MRFLVNGARSVLLPSVRFKPICRMASTINKTAHPFDRSQLEQLLLKRFFYAPAFEIYGGVAGFYDFGPPGASLQANILSAWRNHFIIEEEMLEVESTVMTVEDVLKTSGHVDKFSDWMVTDSKTGEIFRADHLVEAVLEARLKGDKEARGVKEAEVVNEEDDKKKKKKKAVKSTAVKLADDVVTEYEETLAKIDNYGGPELHALILKFKIKSPEENDLTPPREFNLMFSSQIGPTGQLKGYLRPETAQGHFINFNRLLEFNNGRLPFASAQIGKSFRNEIAPRQGLIRVREFVMAEIEHYVDPNKKDHPRFEEVKDIKLRLLPKETQSAGKTDLTEISIGEAVSKGIVNNETLGYFIARIYLFLVRIGIDPSRLRFRQHMANEMAHYASDCWDAEIQSSYGWIECVGCADRSAYDLTVHSVRTGIKLVVRETLAQPRVYDKWVIEWDKKKMGPLFKKDAKKVEDGVEGLDQERLECLAGELAKDGQTEITGSDGNKYTISKDFVTISKKTFKDNIREFCPNVIEPSFGIGRILYSLLEHSFWAREDDVQRAVLSLPIPVAPVKVLIVPLSSNDEFRPLVRDLSAKLRKAGISSRVDDSNASIGKRYSRNDELGTPFGITVDFASIKNGTITLRERDTTDQLIGSIDNVIQAVEDLCSLKLDWNGACQKLEKYSGVQDA
ncbi:glycyl-tRNA synthetase [Atractiella rhizophila]|nr:glycyl-tRNA synthetase [Atractiella rhizophila]